MVCFFFLCKLFPWKWYRVTVLFVIYWLVVSIFFIFRNIWDNIFHRRTHIFKMVKTTNQYIYTYIYISSYIMFPDLHGVFTHLLYYISPLTDPWCWYIYIYKHTGGILMGSMLPYIAAPWILWVYKHIHIICRYCRYSYREG